VGGIATNHRNSINLAYDVENSCIKAVSDSFGTGGVLCHCDGNVGYVRNIKPERGNKSVAIEIVVQSDQS